MGRKNGNLLELLVDKIVLAVVGLICLLVFFVFILGNPNSAEYRGWSYGPGEIDKFIKDQSVNLEEELRADPNTNRIYEPQKPECLALVGNSVKNIDIAKSFPIVGYVKPTEVVENRVYRMPQLPDVNSVSIAGIRMAAFVPTQKLDESLAYEDVAVVLEDLYFITVESQIDISKLYADFYDSFAGANVKASWREDKYSKPIFAQVELQRRAVLVDGSLGSWQAVPKTKIFNLEKTLQIPEQANQYEIEIAMHNFSSSLSVRREILQPSTYDNAIPSEQWLSPSFYNQQKERLAKELEQQRRAEIEVERSERLRERTSRTTERGTTRTASSRAIGNTRNREGGGDMMGMPGGGGMMGGMPGGGTPARTTTRNTRSRRDNNRRETQTAPERSTGRRGLDETVTKLEESEAEKFASVQLSPDVELESLDKLYFWAHDDTAENGKTYQYRMRIGIFNPIAGKDWFSQDQQDIKDEIVLWSDYSAPSKSVLVPQNVYFFPKSVRQVKTGESSFDKIVEINVSRYTLGNWISQTFNVRCGEEIGRIVSAAGSRLEDAGAVVDTIDYTTGTVVVDTELATEWTGAGVLRPRSYEELIYGLIDDAGTLKRIPVKQRNWPNELSSIFDEIEDAEKLPPIELLSRSDASSKKGTIRNSPSQPGMNRGGDMGMPMGGNMMGMPGGF